jgi:hypothetical protein
LFVDPTTLQGGRRMFTMDQVHTIRDLYYNQGLSLTDIAKKLNCDWRTVRKYVDQEDFSPPAPVPKGKIQHESKLDPFKPLIDKWLIGDTEYPSNKRASVNKPRIMV